MTNAIKVFFCLCFHKKIEKQTHPTVTNSPHFMVLSLQCKLIWTFWLGPSPLTSQEKLTISEVFFHFWRASISRSYFPFWKSWNSPKPCASHLAHEHFSCKPDGGIQDGGGNIQKILLTTERVIQFFTPAYRWLVCFDAETLE